MHVLTILAYAGAGVVAFILVAIIAIIASVLHAQDSGDNLFQ